MLIRLEMPWGSSLYRFDRIGENGWPVNVRAFVKTRAARAVLGRWTRCPNVNVAKRIAIIACVLEVR